MKKHYSIASQNCKTTVKKNTVLTQLKKTSLSLITNFKIICVLLVFLFSGISFGQGDNCGNAIPISIDGSCLSGSVVNTLQDLPTISGCTPGTFRRERWYTFTVTGGPKDIIITASTGNRNLYLQLISSTSSCTGLTQIACANNDTSGNTAQTESISTNLVDGIYYIKVANVGNNNNMTLNSLCITTPAVNDFCSGAIALTSWISCSSTTGSTVNANDNNETGDCTAGTEKAIWYKFTATNTTHTVTVDGISGFDAVIGVISSCGSNTSPTGGGCVDNTADDGIETLNLSGLTIGSEYYIQVYEYFGDSTVNGFTICVTNPMSACVTPAAQPSLLSFGTVTSSSIVGSFTAASPSPDKYLVVRSTSNIAPSPGPVNTTAYALNDVISGATVVSINNSLTFTSSGLNGDTLYYFYIYSFNDTSCSGGPLYLTTSPLSGSQATLCDVGTGVGSNTVTSNSAIITWLSSGNYVVEYGLSGFIPGSGTSAGIGGTIASISATSSISLSSLLGSTSYDVYIRQDCNLSSFYSGNSAIHSFTTCVNPIITTQPSTPAAVCAGDGVATISVSTSGASGFQWRRNGVALTNVAPFSNVTTATLTITNAAFTENGSSYTVVVSSGSCSVTSSAVVLTVNAAPSNPGNPTSNSPQCMPSGVTLTRAGLPPGGSSWYWQTVANGTSTINNGATFVVSTSGTYYIRARNNTTGCWSTGSGSLTVVVNALPGNPGNPTSNSPQCASPGVTLTRVGTVPAGETWYWQTASGGTTAVNSGATFTVTNSGTYYIRARNNSSFCWSSGEGSIAVVVVVSPANPNNPTSNSPQCASPGVTLSRTGSVPAGETWYWQTNATGTSTANSGATFVVSTTGTYYIRSQSTVSGCWSSGSGSLAVVVNTVPSATITPSPATASTNVCYSGIGARTSVSWATTATATSYDIYFGAGSLPGTLTANVLTNTYSTGTLLANTTYYWRVVAKNACGNALSSATWTFTTLSIPCSCTSTSSFNSSYFTNFTTTGGTSNISNNTGFSGGGYGNFTASQNVSQIANAVISYSTTIQNVGGGVGVAIFVDWNQNGVFTDTGETVFTTNTYIYTNPFGTIIVPAGATVGATRMRIVVNYNSSTPSSCNSGIDGETEDYKFTVLPPLPCSGNPSGLNVIINTQTTATLSWVAASPAPANGYQYFMSTTNTTPSAGATPTGSTTAGVTTVLFTGLTPGVTNYIWVRSNCGGALGQGVWIGVATYTPPTCIIGPGTGTTALSCPSVLSGGLLLNGADPAGIDCSATSSCVDLQASYINLGETSSYTVDSINYAPPYQFECLRNPVSVNVDDVWSPVINLPFDFCFYGNNYSQCLIGSNGLLTFDMVNNIPGGPSEWQFASNIPSTNLFRNTIFGVFHDIDPSVGGEIGYELITLNTGCRALVASWSDIPMFSTTCNSILYSGMMVLYENTNIIEVYIQEKNVCASWNDGNAIVGIQNSDGTLAAVAPGRNGLDANWTVTNEAWRFVPSGTAINTIKWYEGSGTAGTVLGTTDIINVCPTVTTTYTAEVTYSLCNGSTLIETDETTVTINGSKMWDGSESRDWTNANNWTPSGVPTSADCVIIPDVSNDPIIYGPNYKAYGLYLTVLAGATLQVNTLNSLTITDYVSVAPTGSFTLKNGSSLIQINDAAVNDGNIIMERVTNIRKLDYVYWSSPVESFISSAISPATSTNLIWKWNTTIANTNGGQGNWVSGNEVMVPGKGYIIRGPSNYTTTPTDYTATFTGKPHNGVIQPSIYRGNRTEAMGSIIGNNGVTITPKDDNWNLVGNPYPSAISVYDFLSLNTNIDGNVRLWTHGTTISSANLNTFYQTFNYNYSVTDYINYNGTGPTPPGFDGFIGAGQAFFVGMNDGIAATDVVTFNNSLRSDVYRNDQFFRASMTTTMPTNTSQGQQEKNRIWLSLVNATTVATTTLIGYVEGATIEKDRMFDTSCKTGTAMAIYSLLADKTMIINGRPLPFDNEDRVPLGITIPADGVYNIALSLFDGLFLNVAQNIYLEDTVTGIIHDLRQNPYSFTASVGMVNDRFILRYTNTTLGLDTLINTNQTYAYTADNVLNIQSTSIIEKVVIYDITGKLVKSYIADGSNNRIETDFFYSAGVYLAKITLENDIVIDKKLIHK